MSKKMFFFFLPNKFLKNPQNVPKQVKISCLGISIGQKFFVYLVFHWQSEKYIGDWRTSIQENIYFYF